MTNILFMTIRMQQVIRVLRHEIIGCVTMRTVFSRVHATLQPALSVRWSVGKSVGWSVGHILLFYDFISLTSLLLPKWSSDLKYSPPHLHATLVAVYPPSVSGLVWITRNEC